MATPKQDAAAVRRILARQAKLKAQLAEAERNLKPHALRLCNAHGYPTMLRPEALRRLAEAA